MKTNSKKNTALVLASAALAMGMGLVLAPQTSLAQRAPAATAGDQHDCRGPGNRARGGHDERTPAERLAHWQELLERVSQRLQLSARQNAEAQRILADSFARITELRATTTERTPERRAARQALMQAADARFSAILTPQQLSAWTALKAELRERHGRGHHGGRGHDGGEGSGGRGFGPRTEAQRGI